MLVLVGFRKGLDFCRLAAFACCDGGKKGLWAAVVVVVAAGGAVGLKANKFGAG